MQKRCQKPTCQVVAHQSGHLVVFVRASGAVTRLARGATNVPRPHVQVVKVKLGATLARLAQTFERALPRPRAQAVQTSVVATATYDAPLVLVVHANLAGARRIFLGEGRRVGLYLVDSILAGQQKAFQPIFFFK
jgi:hypothetical protein